MIPNNQNFVFEMLHNITPFWWWKDLCKLSMNISEINVQN